MKYILLSLSLVFAGCRGPEVPLDALCEPEAYGPALLACTELSRTIEESIDCENALRARCGRPLRVYPGLPR